MKNILIKASRLKNSGLKNFRLLFALLFFTAMATLAAPALDVAQIDRERILKAAAVALGQEPLTITKFHAALSKGGEHDFYSNADYFWPNPNTTNGLPYVNRDGKTNPGNFVAHRQAMRQLSDAIAALGAAYEITGDDRYAKKSADLLRVFFLDPATRMNPSLQYAQAVPGVSTGAAMASLIPCTSLKFRRRLRRWKNRPLFRRRTWPG